MGKLYAKAHDSMRRIGQNRVKISHPSHIPTTLFANPQVEIEPQAVMQVHQFLDLQDKLAQIQPSDRFWPDERRGVIDEVVLTPDFHRGSPIPVGSVIKTKHMVIPEAVGNDICCGMRLLALEMSREEFEAVRLPLRQRTREVFFGGGRNLMMSPKQREALAREGLTGLWEQSMEHRAQGLWKQYDQETQLEDLGRVHHWGSWQTSGLFCFEDWVKGSGQKDGRGAHLGSIGGGNHFVEFQVVDQIHEGQVAYHWGLKKSQVMVMIHTGSLSFGHAVNLHFRALAKNAWPTRIPSPGFAVIPTHSELGQAYLSAMNLAANLAHGNRLFLGLMALQAMEDVLGRRISARLVHDSPHNLAWVQGEEVLHRKSAHPAHGPSPENPGPFRYTGSPVIVPGSMGATSYLMAGQGSKESLESACHGAGRALSRGAARHKLAGRGLPESIDVVGPVDLNSPALRARPDIRNELLAKLAEEAPAAYKPITPVVQTVEEAGVAKRVLSVQPLMTLKG